MESTVGAVGERLVGASSLASAARLEVALETAVGAAVKELAGAYVETWLPVEVVVLVLASPLSVEVPGVFMSCTDTFVACAIASVIAVVKCVRHCARRPSKSTSRVDGCGG